jgi:hypothetical protein
MAPSDLRALTPGRAILLATGAKAGQITLMPWYTSPRKDTITQASATAAEALTQRARTAQPQPGAPL